MAWYNFWKKKPVENRVVLVEKIAEAKVKPELSALDYPKSQYKVYWETHLTHAHGAWHAEVRFIGYNGHDHRTYHSVAAPTKAQAQALAEKLIVEKMPDYKR